MVQPLSRSSHGTRCEVASKLIENKRLGARRGVGMARIRTSPGEARLRPAAWPTGWPAGRVVIDRIGRIFKRVGSAAPARQLRKAVDEARLGRSLRRRVPGVSRGARFCPADAPRVVWEVASLFNGLDGVPYADLFCASDRTLRKVVAQAALQDSRLFAPVTQDRPAAPARRAYAAPPVVTGNGAGGLPSSSSKARR